VTDDVGDLYPGERVLWTGAPVKFPVLSRGDALLVPFSIVWCGFAIFWETLAAVSGAPPFFLVWGGTFVLLGLYFVFGRLIVRYLTLRGTRYVITDRRVIVCSTALGRRREQSSYLRSLGAHRRAGCARGSRPHRHGAGELRSLTAPIGGTSPTPGPS
jgi:hypothetical protein